MQLFETALEGQRKARSWFWTISSVQVELVISFKRCAIYIVPIVIFLWRLFCRIVSVYLFQGNVNQLMNQFVDSSSTLCRHIHMNQSIPLYRSCRGQANVNNCMYIQKERIITPQKLYNHTVLLGTHHAPVFVIRKENRGT